MGQILAKRPQIACRFSARHIGIALSLVLVICSSHAYGQDIPRSSGKPWHSEHQADFVKKFRTWREQLYAVDSAHTYTLAELVNMAESHNPITRVAWENAKARAESLGVARSALFPTVSALVLARTSRQNTLYAAGFYRDTVNVFQPALNLNYMIFDFGGRSGAINAAK